MTNCTQCGSALPGNKKFCPNCGAPAPGPQRVEPFPPATLELATATSTAAPLGENPARTLLLYVLKRLPLMFLTFFLTWAIHTWLLVVQNGGFDFDSTHWISPWLNVTGNLLSAAVVWGSWSALIWSFVFSVFRYGPIQAFMSVVGAPVSIFQTLRRATTLGRTCWLLGAGLALFLGMLLPFNGAATFSLAVLLTFLGLSPLTQQLASAIIYLFVDVLKLATQHNRVLKIVQETCHYSWAERARA